MTRAPTTSEQMVATLERRVSSFSLAAETIVVDDHPGWMPLGKVISTEDHSITRVVDEVGLRRNTSDRKVAAMLSWKAYSYLCARLPIAGWVELGWVPDLRAENAAVRFDDETGFARFSMITPRFFVAEDDPASAVGIAVATPRGELVARLIDTWWHGHVELAVDRWSREAPIGRRGLVAFAVSQATGLVAACGDGGRVARHAAIERWRAALPPDMRAMAPVVERRASVDDAWMPMALRTSCCLAHQLDTASYCVTCNLLDDDERTELMAASGAEWRPVEGPGRASNE